MYNATEAITTSDIIPSLRVQPVRHMAAKTLPRKVIHRRCIAQEYCILFWNIASFF